MRSTLLVLLLLASPATATAAPTREATSALQQVAAFDAELHRRDSATATLQIWCDAHGPGAGTKIVPVGLGARTNSLGRLSARP